VVVLRIKASSTAIKEPEPSLLCAYVSVGVFDRQPTKGSTRGR
jgi:hypothetical protein